MKKILFAVFALAALASCTNNEVIELNQQAIAFGEAFVDNSTRAEYNNTTKLVEEFNVYGTVKGDFAEATTVQIFGGDVVRGGAYKTAWTCSNIQYWVPNAIYNFAAIVDGQAATCVNGLPATINHTVVNGNEDLLYARSAADIETSEDGTPNPAKLYNGLVAFTFDHLLSKVSFTVTDNMGANYKVVPTAINVTGIAKQGSYNVASKAWTNTAIGTTLDSALNFVTESHQILPVAQELGVEIVYQIYFVKDSIETLVSTATKTGTIASKEYKANTAYNINAAIGATAIQFTVTEVNGFGAPVAPDSDPSITIQ